jgi:hypothetical protein
MTTINHLGIFGDSFADIGTVIHPVPRDPWISILPNLLQLDSTIHALCGTSIWWSFNNFLKHYKNYSHVVFVYSQHNRWHSLQQKYETMHHITVNKLLLPTVDKEQRDAAKILFDAYPIVNSEEFDIYVYQKIFNDVNQLCFDNNIKLINFMPFDNGTLIDYSRRAGFCIYNATGLTQFEQQQLTHSEQTQFINMVYSGDMRYCHMNWKNNKLVADRMYENLNNTSTMIDILKDSEVSNDPDCIRELLKHYDKRK